ncbi:hypothetical protein K469DRAFT_683923 [Zopfia rhizophila CBS 207.26]|uniref:AAA+ ATPase domain-containing protein n=1 Tax=Zopfia rhizophila CBS 207.26 TaxID=1314779 RepID=A0A6A6DAC6_9PEZI|nr:hypothetical protein K469DRAFT_683923 [Zopfia rhizophila CBS 207.26]
MDPLSAMASIIAILQLSSKVVGYLTDVKDASKERAKCAVEASNLHSLLLNLRFRLEEGSGDTPWYTAVRALTVKNGPLNQFKQALETLQTKMTDGGRLKKAGEALVWKFKKEEVANGPLSGVDKIRQDQDSARHRRLLEWISPTDYPAQQSDIIKRRQEGTGQWFLDAPEVARWLSEAKGTLFCLGIPGAGKTMVAAIAIDHLLNMLLAILKQLVQARPPIVEPVEQLHKQHADRGTRPSLDEVFGALRDVLTRCSTIHIVIDALDECRDGTCRQFLAKLRDLQAGRDIRLMATSRFILEIVDAFREALRLEVQASWEDVKCFVAGQTYRLPRCIQRDPALQDMVQEKIVEVVDGMFLLARLHTDSLLDKTTTKDRIEGQLGGHHELAKKVLSWITFAKRPLTTAEICCALAVEPEEAEVDPENIPDVEDLVSVCAGLVVVDPESAIIRLVYYTTQEYFERIRDAWNPGA